MMIVTVITPPSPVLTWDDLKAALRLDSEDERGYVEGLAASALAWIGGPDGWLGRSIGEQELEARFACFPPRTISVPFGPVIPGDGNANIIVTYLDASRAEQTLDPATYQVLTDGRLMRVGDTGQWPATAADPEAVRVRYHAGDVPTPVLQAMKLLVAHWFVNRETVTVGTVATDVPLAVEALLSTFRRYS